MQYLTQLDQSTYCEWKGAAGYYSVNVNGKSAPASAWFYAKPNHPYEAIANHVAFYASKMDECYVDEERVTPQAGGFYGGWVTSWISGGKKGFKGGPGTWGW
jgi:hypothetical protein